MPIPVVISAQAGIHAAIILHFESCVGARLRGHDVEDIACYGARGQRRGAKVVLDLKSLIRTIPDYPKKGIMFRDVTTLMGNAQGFKAAIERMAAPYANARRTLLAARSSLPIWATVRACARSIPAAASTRRWVLPRSTAS